MSTLETTLVLPGGMPCPGCGYDVGGLPADVCPECGRGISADDAADFLMWRSSGAECRRVEVETFWAGLAASGAMLAMGWAASGSAVFGLVVGVGAVVVAGAVFGLAGLAGRGTSTAHRQVIEAAVVAAARWLLLPWAVTVPFACAMTAVGLAGRAIGVVNGPGSWAWIAAVVVWLTAALAISPELYFATLRARLGGLRGRLPGWVTVLAITMIWVPSMMLGAGGLVMAFGLGAMVGRP